MNLLVHTHDKAGRLKEQKLRVLNECWRRGYVTDTRVLDALMSVQRSAFFPPKERYKAWDLGALPLADGSTLTSPDTCAFMLQQSDLKRGQKVLEIGTGSGYTSALAKEMAGSRGRVYSIERIPSLVQQARRNLHSAGYDVHVLIGEGSHGYPFQAPFDRIIFCASTNVLYHDVMTQLADGGLMLLPISEPGSEVQHLFRIRRQGNDFDKQLIADVNFIPMVEAKEQQLDQFIRRA